MDIKESDWRVFKTIKEKAIDTFCQQALDDFEEMIHHDSESVRQKYETLYRLVLNRNKIMELLFDRHSRSMAALQLTGIRGEGLADDVLLNQLSDEFLKFTDPKEHGWRLD